jgi:YegS/Rv2252/BmrU family lipid kinase
MKSSAVLISNPIAYRASSKKIARASYYLQSKGYTVESLFSDKKGDAEALAHSAIQRSPSLIIAAGGDGTFNEVINGIAGSEIPMAILPLGTTNVLAKELGIPENVERSMDIAIKGIPRVVSLGKITLHQGSLKTRYFCMMAGIGFDAMTVFGLNKTFKKISGKGAHFYSGMKVLSRFRPAEVTFTIGEKSYRGYSAVIGKGAKYGGHIKVTPDARLTDPNLYICIFKGKKRSDIFRYVMGVLTKSHLSFKDIEYRMAQKIQVDGSAHVQIDGDYLGMTPAIIETAPVTVRLIYPDREHAS